MSVRRLLATPARRPRLPVAAVAVVATGGVAAAVGAAPSAAKPVPPTAKASSVAAKAVKVAQTRLGAVGYRAVGRGSPLVLIMGFGSSMEDWQPTFVDALARRHRVIIFDNAGIGSTSAPRGAPTLPKMADQTAALIAKLRLGRANVLGWSMGGMIAQALAVRHPRQVRRLVLAATKPGDGRAKSISPATAEALAATPETFLAALFPSGQKAALKAYTDGIARYKTRGTVPDAIYATQRAAINRWLAGQETSGPKVRRLVLRTLVAQGIQDRLNPLVNSRLLARMFPHARLKLYSDAGHAFLFQSSTRFAAYVDAFLRRGARR